MCTIPVSLICTVSEVWSLLRLCRALGDKCLPAMLALQAPLKMAFLGRRDEALPRPWSISNPNSHTPYILSPIVPS